MLVAVHRVRPAPSVQLHTGDADLDGRGHPHPEPGAPQFGGEPPHLLHVLAAHLH